MQSNALPTTQQQHLHPSNVAPPFFNRQMATGSPFDAHSHPMAPVNTPATSPSRERAFPSLKLGP